MVLRLPSDDFMMARKAAPWQERFNYDPHLADLNRAQEARPGDSLE
jgi:hypothetical protein